MAISGARAFGFWIDPAVSLHDSGSPTFDSTTVWHDGVETVTFEGFNRRDVESRTGNYAVNKMTPGEYSFPVVIQLRPLSGAKRDAWNAAVKAGTAVTYRFIEDRNSAASATNIQIQGAIILPTLLLAATEFGGIVNQSITCNPGGEEPYVTITGGSAVNYGDT